jgi:hypothetical protein
MAVRRNRIRYTADQLLNTVLFGSLAWPGRTVRLERDSLLDYRNRPTSGQVSAAELYHENSKLSPELLPGLALAAVDPSELRREFLRRRGALAARAPGHQLGGMELWDELLGPVAERSLEQLYAIELRVADGGAVVAYEPASKAFRPVKNLEDGERAQLDTAVLLVDNEEHVPRPLPLLLVLACFPRNEIVFGERGYRRTLLEAGQVTREIVTSAAEHGRTVRIHYEFADRDVDRIMEVDGVELSTVIAIAIW